MRTPTPGQLAALRRDRHVAAVANAGSGKTFALVARYTRFVLEDGVSPSEILAVTFTEEAAAEMKRRVAEELDARLVSEDPSDVALASDARDALADAPIQTIHAFCLNLLREYALEADVDPNAKALAGEEANEWKREAARAAVVAQTNKDVEGVKRLARLFGSVARLERALVKALGARLALHEFGLERYDGGVEDIERTLSETYDKAAEWISAEEVPPLLQDIESINRRAMEQGAARASAAEGLLENAANAKRRSDALEALRELREITTTKAGKIRKLEYLPERSRDGLHDGISRTEERLAFLGELDREPNHRPHAEFVAVFAPIFRDANERYERRKQTRAALDFDDMILGALALLGRDETRAELERRYRAVMVDEFQDVDETQRAIVSPLVGELRRGVANLFVAGDDKQSVYRFRGADPETFRRTRDDVTRANGATATLAESFRAAPNVCGFVNAVFAEAFRNPRPRYHEPEHSELVCAKDPSEPGSIEFLVAGDVESEADLTAERVAALLDERDDLERREIAVLCRKRKSFAPLRRAFARLGIPAVFKGEREATAGGYLRDALNYLDATLDERNDKALVGVLQSPLIGMDDADILEAAEEEGDSFWEKFAKAASRSERGRKIHAAITRHRAALGVAYPSALIDAIHAETRWASLSRRGPDAARAYEILSRAAIDYERERTCDAAAFAAEARDRVSAVAPPEENGAAVVVSTIHQAKGLEFEAVFVFAADEREMRDVSRASELTIDKEFGFLTKTPRRGDPFFGYEAPPLGRLRDFVERRRSEAEVKRLLYVATTRAKRYLAICASGGGETRTGMWKVLRDALGERYDEHGATIMTTLSLSLPEEEYRSRTLDLEIGVPIVREVPSVATRDAVVAFEPPRPRATEAIDARERYVPTLSVSQLETYRTCPYLYYIAYELGLLLSDDGDERRERAALRGTLLHEAIARRMPIERARAIFRARWGRVCFGAPSETINERTEEALDTLRRFRESETAKRAEATKAKRELELFATREGYRLQGVIDLLAEGDGAIEITDYKTGAPNEAAYARYEFQLGCYAVLAAARYPDATRVTTRLHFLDSEERPSARARSRAEIEVFAQELDALADGVRRGEYPKRRDRCDGCSAAELCGT
jgi:ATP-dependent helicase/nuclease subunit A